MFCPNCGTNNVDGAVFCENCGQRMNAPSSDVETPVGSPAAEAPAAPVYAERAPRYQAPPQYQPSGPAYNGNATVYADGRSSAIAALKRVLSSPLFLLGAILYSLASILIFIADVTFTDKIRISFNGFSVTFGTDVGSAVSSLISFAIVATGIWLIYFAALKKDNTCSPAGFIVLKVLSIISLVALCIAASGVIVVLVALLLVGKDFQIESFIKFGDSPLDAELKTLFDGILGVDKWVWAVVFGAVLAVIVLAIIFMAKLSGTLNAVKRTAKTGVPAKGTSLYVALFLFICAASSLSLAVSMMTVGLIFHGIATVVSAAAFIFFGIVIVELRSAMKSELEKSREIPAGSPIGGQVPYAAAPGSLCPRCGAPLSPDFKLCPHCGLPRQN